MALYEALNSMEALITVDPPPPAAAFLGMVRLSEEGNSMD